LTPEQRGRRDDLERQVLTMRLQRSTYEEAEYYHRLELLLVELARIHQSENSLAPR